MAVSSRCSFPDADSNVYRRTFVISSMGERPDSCEAPADHAAHLPRHGEAP